MCDNVSSRKRFCRRLQLLYISTSHNPLLFSLPLPEDKTRDYSVLFHLHNWLINGLILLRISRPTTIKQKKKRMQERIFVLFWKGNTEQRQRWRWWANHGDKSRIFFHPARFREGQPWSNERAVFWPVTNESPGEADTPGRDNVIKFTSRVSYHPAVHKGMSPWF